MSIKTLTNILCKLSGEDLYVIRKCDKKYKIRFSLAGLFVLLIFSGCFISCSYAIYALFNCNYWYSIPIGLFFSWMIVVIYLLLLYTLTPSLLTEGCNPKLTILSLGLRIGFIGILAIIIAKPFSVFLFETVNTNLSEKTESYKKEIKIRSYINADSLFVAEELKLKDDLNSCLKRFASIHEMQQAENYLKNIFDQINTDAAFLGRVSLLQQKILTKNGKRPGRQLTDSINGKMLILVETATASNNQLLLLLDRDLSDIILPSTKADKALKEFLKAITGIFTARKEVSDKLNNVLGNSNFFIAKIKIIAYYPFSWIIDSLFVLLFILPVYWKYNKRKLNEYFKKRKDIETALVNDEYIHFKKQYKFLLLQLTGKEIDFYEPCSDPPFNTIKKTDSTQYKKQEDLLKKLYGGE